MFNFSAAQQAVSQLVPNISGQAAGILQALTGGSSDANQGLLGGGKSFDGELNQAHKRVAEVNRSALDARDQRDAVRRPDAPRADRADEARPSPKENASHDVERYDDVAAPYEVREPAKPIHARDVQESDAQDNDNLEVGAVEATAQDNQIVENVNAEPQAKVGELLVQAEEALEKIQAFQVAYPQLADQLQAVLAPLTQSLEQVIGQLKGLDASSAVSLTDLDGGVADALGKLQQLAVLFSAKAAGKGGEQADLQLAGGTDLAELESLIKPLKQASGQAVGDLNEITKALKDLAGPVVKTSEAQAAALTKVDVVGKENAPQIQLAVANVASDQTVKYNAASDAVNAEATANPKAQAAQAGQQNSQGQNDQQSGQQQAFAQAQAQAQTQSQTAAQSSTLAGSAARADSLASGSATTTQAGQPNLGATPGTVTLSREAANFEQILKQAGRPPVAEQVQVQIKSMVRQGESKMIVKLDPPELGQLEIKFEMSKSEKTTKTNVIINVERQQTLELLQRDSKMLVQALADAGLQLDGNSLSFNLKGGNDSSGGGQQQPKNIYPTKEEQFDEEMLSVVSETYTLESEPGVNIHI